MSDGIMNLNVIGARVATSADGKEGAKKMMYYPAYKNDKGEDKSARLTIPVLINLRNQEQPSNILLTAWGKMADICAKALSPGREISFTAEPRQYMSQYKIKGQPVLIEGKPLNITGYSYTLKNISFGAESAAFVASEVARGLRGADWFKPGHADNVALTARRKGINDTAYAPGVATFGYSAVGGSPAATAPAVVQAPVVAPASVVVPAAPTAGVTPEVLAAAMAVLQGQGAETPIAPQQAATVAPAQVAAAPAVTIF